MTILDGHIHIEHDEMSGSFFERAGQAGVSGGIVMSPAPSCFSGKKEPAGMQSAKLRLEALFARTVGHDTLYPIFWIDPMEEDSLDQVDVACEYGVSGFKVICDHYYAYENKPMAVFRKIAGKGKPILFHSGILWDGKFSSLYNRPANFEALIEIPGVRFSLAHASWPWIDECIALYGKMQHAMGKNENPAEMFIDITPGTPEIYRKELLTKLHRVGYDVENNIVFGADCLFDDYQTDWVKQWIATDTAIYTELGLGGDVAEKAFGGNLLRFVGAVRGSRNQRKLTTTG